MRRNKDRSILHRRLGRARALAAAATLALGLTAGCGGPPPVRDVTNPDPSGKIPAIVAAVQKGDRRALNQLVKDLDNDDPAVRFYAIEGLRRLTGKTFDYRYFDDASARRPAVERWKQWLRERPPQ